MCIVEDVLVIFNEGLLGVLRRKGCSEFVLDEIRAIRDIKRITVKNDIIQRDLLHWLDRNTTVIFKVGRGKNTILEWIACLYIGETVITRNLYICYLYKDRIVLLSPFASVEKAILSIINKLENEYALTEHSAQSV